jgi:hypothetical protein
LEELKLFGSIEAFSESLQAFLEDFKLFESRYLILNFHRHGSKESPRKILKTSKTFIKNFENNIAQLSRETIRINYFEWNR